ncbi:NADH dehydrogenase [Amycolatopsis deserti]|uniref:NADH dehydrogenase n=1 Tax=Amycolatopsis deserti TaxID=185696 RepID=A0ABQ3IQI1_9PSEU|nr:FAD-dependent oxidoreductase [Amycolatopsis deserti]GHE91319.1 NADH dehydrogenase [Amycolatopsis deserti]
MSGNTEVVVIGGGYAGVMAANRLTQRDDVTVTVVNPRPEFVDRIRLHQLVAGTNPAVVEYRKVLAGGVRLVVDTATRIDAAGRRVTLASGDTIGYDYLVYAVGSGSADPSVPGAAEFAHPLASLEEAERVKPLVEAASTVTVVGGGPTGIETAAELAGRGRAVTLVCGGELGPYLHPRGRKSVAGRLAKLGVTVLENVTVTAVTRDAVQLSDGRALLSGVTLWTAGFGVPDLAARSGLTTDALGRLLTDETLTSVDDQRIVAAGDSAAPSGLPVRMSCQAAVQVGPQAAQTVLARIAGSKPAPIDVGFAGLCVSLGRHHGIFQFSTKDDTAKPSYIGGRLGAKVKEVICRSIVWQLGYEARHPGKRKWWATDAKRRELVRAEAPAALDRAA